MSITHITHPLLDPQPRAYRAAELLLRRPGVRRIVLTPDLHPGSSTPIGTVVETDGVVMPGLPGGDVGCGMGLHVLDLPASAFEDPSVLDRLEASLQHRLFGGGREVILSSSQRRAILSAGAVGLWETYREEGLWAGRDADALAADVARMHRAGSWAGRERLFSRWADAAGDGYDGQLGSVGGGNHCLEVGRIGDVLDGAVAHAWGIPTDAVCVLVHSGSLGFGHAIRAAHPEEAILLDEADAVLADVHAAANVAVVNRLLLARTAVRSLEDALGRSVDHRLVGDAPHNMIWVEGDRVLHRKGATPAEGPDERGWLGEPVIIPGSMGTASYLLVGHGRDDALRSTAHGAGRALSRGRAAHELETSSAIRTVLPLSAAQAAREGRPDIARVIEQRLKEEAPGAYKDVELVVEATVESDAAHPVARLRPIMTAKGF